MKKKLSSLLTPNIWFAVAFTSVLINGFLLTKKTPEDALKYYRTHYPFIDVSRHIIPKEDFIVNIQPLREKIREIAKKYPQDQITIYLEVLNSGANVSVNPDSRILPASFLKLPIAMIAMKKIEENQWKKDDLLVLLSEDVDAEWGELYKQPIGTTYTIQELIEHILVSSDNTAYKILLRNMSEADLQSIVDAVGLEELFSEDGKISSKDYSRLLRALYTASYTNKENSQLLLSLLAQTPYREYLQSGIDDQTPFAHKIGENKTFKIYADSGIVFLPNRPYLLTVLIESPDENGGRENALAVMKEISQASYEYFKQ